MKAEVNAGNAALVPRPGSPRTQSLSRDLLGSLRNPEFWALSSWLDIVVRYRQSRLGMFWMLVPVIAYVWGLGAYMAPAGQSILSFAAYVGIGIVVFRLVNSVMVESTSAFTGAQSFILDGHVRMTDFVLRVIAKALFYFAVSIPVVASALAFTPNVHLIGFVVATGSLMLVLANLMWMSVVFGLAGARFPDFGQLISNIFIFAFLMTPITWYAANNPPGTVRGLAMRANPLYHMVEVVRAPILGSPIEVHSFYYLVVMAVIGWIAAIWTYRRFARIVPIWL